MKKAGFTLAEVLITLSIVGVVASLTIPNLNTSTTATKNRSVLKKTISTISGAAQVNMLNNGWDFAGISDFNVVGCTAQQDPKSSSTMCALLNRSLTGERFLGRANSATEYDFDGIDNQGFIGSEAWYILYQTSDGAVVGLNGHATNCTQDTYLGRGGAASTSCIGFIDVNGSKGPNQEIRCASGDIDYTHSSSAAIFAACEVDANTIADVFPIMFYDSSVELSSNAGIGFINDLTD